MNPIMTVIVVLAIAGGVHSEGKVDWTYSGEHGPEYWASLSADFGACGGKNQSPVNLTGFVEADLIPIQFDYAAGGSEILNNGHTVQVNYAAGSSIVVDGIEFGLKQFHFHAPSENPIAGKSYPLEAHLVHADHEGNLAVVAVMFSDGSENKVIAQAWANMPEARVTNTH